MDLSQHPVSEPGTRRRTLLLAGYLSLVIVLTLPVIDWRTSVDFDNSVRVWIVTRPFDTIVNNVREWELSPPLWHILMHWVVQLSPDAAIPIIRVVNYVLYLGLVPVAYLIGARIDSKAAGGVAALLVPWNQTVFDHVTETNHYLLFAFLAGLFTWLLFVVLAGRTTRRQWLAFALIAAAYGFTHYFAVLHISSAAIVVVVLISYRNGVFRSLYHREFNAIWQRLMDDIEGVSLSHYLLAHLPLGGLLLVWLPVTIQQYQYQPQVAEQTPGVIYVVVSGVGQLWYYFPERTLPPVVIAFVMGFVLLTVLYRASSNRTISIFVAKMALAFGAIVLVFESSDPEHVFFLSVLVPVTVAVGVVAFGRKLRGIHPSSQTLPAPRRVVILTISVLLVGLIFAPYLATATNPHPPEPKTDMKGAVAFADRYTTENTIVLSATQWGQLTLHVYNPRLAERSYGVPYNITNHPDKIRKGTQKGVYTETSRIVYNQGVRPEDRQRLTRITADKNRIVLFVAHGFNRIHELEADLERFGYEQIARMKTRNNGVIVYDNNASTE